MPRKNRFYVAGMPVHIVQRGHNRQPIFFDQGDHQLYLSWLKQAADKYGCAVHAYVLMSNHVHIMVTPSDSIGVSRLMQYVGRYYVPYINHTYGRSGTLWEGRYKSSVIDAENYLLICSRYIELNPVRAAMVDHPIDYPWSSYAANAEGEPDSVLTPHDHYLALGGSQELRCSAYRDLFRAEIGDRIVSDIRASWQTGTPLGNDKFRQQIETVLKCKVGHAQRGRPVKEDKEL